MSRLAVSGLRKSFGSSAVLNGIDLDVEEGAIVALLGSSGSGKTTLLRLIAGFTYPDAGEIQIGDKLVVGDKLRVPPEGRHIGYVPQEGALFPHLTVADNIRFGLPRAERRRSERLDELLHLTGLAGLQGRYPNQLSGGQQQRTALARALAPRPGIVLLDEPFNALDLDLRRAVCADVIAALRAANATAILVTHDPSEAFASADKVAVMRHGVVAQYADPVALYYRPVDAEAARLTGPSILLEATIAEDMAVTILGEIPVARSATRAQGFGIVMLRPEQLVLSQTGEGIEGRVLSSTFYGDHNLVVVEASGKILQARISSGMSFAPGARIGITVQGSCAAFTR